MLTSSGVSASLVTLDVPGFGFVTGTREFDCLGNLLASDNDDAIAVTLDDVTGINDLFSEDQGMVDRAERFLDGSLDVHVLGEDGESEFADLPGISHSAVGDQCRNAARDTGIGQNIAELAGGLIT